MTWLAWILLVTGTGLNALMKPDSNAGILYGLRVIPAIGGGFLFQLPIFAVQSTIIDDDLAIATATLTFFRSVGQAFGVAIGGTVFQNQFDRYINQAVTDGTVPKEFLITGAQAAGAYKVIGTFPGPVVTAYRYIYADSLRTIWYVTTGIAAAGFLVSFLVRNESMDRGTSRSKLLRMSARRRKWERHRNIFGRREHGKRGNVHPYVPKNPAYRKKKTIGTLTLSILKSAHLNISNNFL